MPLPLNSHSGSSRLRAIDHPHQAGCARMPSATVGWTAKIKFNDRTMIVNEQDLVDNSGTKCMVIKPWRSPLISLLTGVTQVEILEAAKQRGIKVSIAGHDRYKKLVHARNMAQSTSLITRDTVSETGIHRLFSDGDEAAADQPPPVFPRRKRKRDDDEPDDTQPGMMTVTVDGTQIECVRPTMSRESICVPLDESNISALLDYLHVGIKSIDDITSAYEWAGRYPGRYKKKGSCSADDDPATPTNPHICESPCRAADPSSGASPHSSCASPSRGTVYQQLLQCSQSPTAVGSTRQ